MAESKGKICIQCNNVEMEKNTLLHQIPWLTKHTKETREFAQMGLPIGLYADHRKYEAWECPECGLLLYFRK